jgi:hypothetical protein
MLIRREFGKIVSIFSSLSKRRSNECVDSTNTCLGAKMKISNKLLTAILFSSSALLLACGSNEQRMSFRAESRAPFDDRSKSLDSTMELDPSKPMAKENSAQSSSGDTGLELTSPYIQLVWSEMTGTFKPIYLRIKENKRWDGWYMNTQDYISLVKAMHMCDGHRHVFGNRCKDEVLADSSDVEDLWHFLRHLFDDLDIAYNFLIDKHSDAKLRFTPFFDNFSAVGQYNKKVEENARASISRHKDAIDLIDAYIGKVGPYGNMRFAKVQVNYNSCLRRDAEYNHAKKIVRIERSKVRACNAAAVTELQTKDYFYGSSPIFKAMVEPEAGARDQERKIAARGASCGGPKNDEVIAYYERKMGPLPHGDCENNAICLEDGQCADFSKSKWKILITDPITPDNRMAFGTESGTIWSDWESCKDSQNWAIRHPNPIFKDQWNKLACTDGNGY